MGQIQKKHVHRVLGMLESRADGGQVSIGDVMDFASISAESFQSAIGQTDADAYGALTAISAEISTMRSEISKLQITDLRQTHIPEAGHELDAIVEATEEATNTIMEAAEAIMAADQTDHAAFAALVSDRVMEIFEACSFQDITGQRISKVVRTIDQIDTRVSAFMAQLGLKETDSGGADAQVEETDQERRQRELILNGPQLKGEGVSQDDVDRMLDEGTGSSQSDIDDMFK